MLATGEHPEQKPHPSIFRTACAAMGVPPDETAMVGDNYDADMCGAIGASM